MDAGKQNYGQLGMCRFHLPREFRAVDTRHQVVGEDQVNFPTPGTPHGLQRRKDYAQVNGRRFRRHSACQQVLCGTLLAGCSVP